MKIAMISDHASPLVAMGGVDTGGQNVHVAALSAALVRRGHDVEVFTRRDDATVPERVRSEDGYDVVHVPAGPARRISKDGCYPTCRSSPSVFAIVSRGHSSTSRTHTSGCPASPADSRVRRAGYRSCTRSTRWAS